MHAHPAALLDCRGLAFALATPAGVASAQHEQPTSRPQTKQYLVASYTDSVLYQPRGAPAEIQETDNQEW